MGLNINVEDEMFRISNYTNEQVLKFVQKILESQNTNWDKICDIVTLTYSYYQIKQKRG